MNNGFDAAALADQLLLARASRRQLDGPIDLPQSVADAYAVQTLVMDNIGPVGAYKTNRLADGTQIVAPIAAAAVLPSGAVFDARDFTLRGVEIELAFRLERALPGADDPDWAQQIARAFVAVPVLEIVDSRLLDHTSRDPHLQLADNLSNAALVYGEPLADWGGCDLSAPQHALAAAGRDLSKGAGAVPGGSALSLLHGFVRCIGDHCGGLVPGQIVTTGALSGVHWLGEDSASVSVQGNIEPFGGVSCSFDFARGG